MRKNLRSIKTETLVLNGKIISNLLSEENRRILADRIKKENLKNYSLNIVSTLNSTIINTLVKRELDK